VSLTIEQTQLLRLVEGSPDQFRTKFGNWLLDNMHIWHEFEKKALFMASRRDVYSARTIIEVMRWETHLRESPAQTFKIVNHHTADLSRLFMLRYPKHEGFFKLLTKRVRSELGS